MDNNKKEFKRGTCYLDNFTNEEIIEIFNNSKTKLEFFQKLGYSEVIYKKKSAIQKKIQELNLDMSKFNTTKISTSNTTKIKTCIICGRPICYSNESGYCQQCYIDKNREEKIRIWKETGDTGCATVGANLRNCIRDYIYQKQDNRCAICGIITSWNNKELKFILDHIDGDASNNQEQNLRLICPNCDSQLDTFKSKNKKSARNHRHDYYEKYKAIS